MAGEAQMRQPQMGLTFEKVWAAMMESDRKAHESKVEHDREMAELRATMKELSKNVWGNNLSIGDLMETLIAARLWEKFSAYPYRFRRAYQRIPIFDEHNRTITDIDILLMDTEWCMAVEVKRKAEKDDVVRHLERMDEIRKYPPAQVVGLKMLGAIAGGIVDPDAQKLAHKCGFFVLELKGEAVELLKTPEHFTAREW